MIKKKNTAISAILIIVAISYSSIQAQTVRKKDTRTILDYYDLIYGVGGVETSKTIFRIKDTKNGYLEIQKDGIKTVVALFRANDESAIVLVTSQECHRFCDSKIEAYELNEGESDIGMGEVTNEVLPQLSTREAFEVYYKKRVTSAKPLELIDIYHKLPRRGKIIEVVGIGEDKREVLLYELHLKNNKFVIVR